MDKYRLEAMPPQVAPALVASLAGMATATIGHFYPTARKRWGI
ncbi:hypothetical protein [Massilia cavernae]|nr:hypothetical protein [Massilia cavernae]